MNVIYRKDHILLFLGDIAVLLFSLVLTIILRYGHFPTLTILESHLEPFSILFLAFTLVYFIAGLYEKHTIIFRKKLPLILLNVQLINTIVGISFFYFIPYFSITPKFFLFLFLILSLTLMYVWRILIVFKFYSQKKQKAILIADCKEALELKEEINNNSRYDLYIVEMIKPSEDADSLLKSINDIFSREKIQMVVIDTHHPLLKNIIPSLYPMAIKGVLFFDIGKIYETIFDRIPVSMVGQTWFIEHMSSMAPKLVYDGIKRSLDIFVSIVVGLISLVLYPFVIIAMKIENFKGVIFIYQPRVGQYNKIINIIKFRTMTVANDNGNVGATGNRVTKVGKFLRMSRIDELPQLWNVLKGDISLIGPRPEMPKYVEEYSKEIPNYTIRHSVKPGLSGWAQIYGEHPHHGVDVAMTANKLSYDLYYIKHRSFLVDLKIALRTIKVLITFVGR
jgi:lipopolysaccharide/colanic/teichoic acid biosynthesis glycosyltransferase